MAEPMAELERMEAASHEDRLRNGDYDRSLEWIRTDEPDGLKAELKGLIGDRGKTTYNSPARKLELDKRYSELSSRLVRTIRLFGSDPGYAREMLPKLWDDILNRDSETSVINCMGRDSNAVRDQLIGPISILTFVSLMATVRPDKRRNLKLAGIIASPENDVLDKVDLVLRLDETNEHTHKERVKLIQLKTTTKNETVVWRYNPEIADQTQERWEEQGDVIRRTGVTRSDLNKMVDFGMRMEEANQGIETEVYIVQVPAFDASAVHNIFGIIRGGEKSSVVSDFESDARKKGLA